MAPEALGLPDRIAAEEWRHQSGIVVPIRTVGITPDELLYFGDRLETGDALSERPGSHRQVFRDGAPQRLDGIAGRTSAVISKRADHARPRNALHRTREAPWGRLHTARCAEPLPRATRPAPSGGTPSPGADQAGTRRAS
ncbi:hypothetical protein SDC9_79148 [bioreactor metagenome]|uniref:Uncharacterized protein n=1 Tax=bioreactor metagenome TaxID=1076179 RepID=A0A644Z368_9ZZZZ